MSRRAGAVRGSAAETGRRTAAFGIRGVPALDRDEHPPAKASGLFRGHDRASAGRHHRQPASSACGYRAAVHKRDDSHDRGTEYRAALDQRQRSGGTLPGAARRGLAEPSAETILDIVTCPGTDTCKLGISSSRGLAAELRKRLAEKNFQFDEAVQNLHIKISGCFNSCGQHHVADLGFYGVSRKMARIRSASLPGGSGRRMDTQRRIVWHAGHGHSVEAHSGGRHAAGGSVRQRAGRMAEMFKDFIKRIGKAELKNSAGRSCAGSRRSGGSFDLHGLGRSPGIQPGGHGRRRMRRRSDIRRRFRSGGCGKGSLRGAGGIGERPGGAGREAGLSGDGACRPGAGETRVSECLRG